MPKSNRRSEPVKSSESEDGKPWAIMLRPGQMKVLCAALSDRELAAILVLEEHARTNPFCYPSIQTIAEHTNRHERKVQEVLRGLKDKGWIKCVRSTRGKLEGIVMLRRADPMMPVADTPEKIADAEAGLRRKREEDRAQKLQGKRGRAKPSMPKSAPSSMPKSAPSSMPKSAPSSMPKSAPELALYGNHHAPLNQHVGEASRPCCPKDSNVTADPGTGSPSIESSTPESPGGTDDGFIAAKRSRLADLLSQLADPAKERGYHALVVNVAAELLVDVLFDSKANKGAHAKILWRVVRQPGDHFRLEPERVLDAYDVATGPRTGPAVENPAAMFTGALRGMLANQAHEEVEAELRPGPSPMLAFAGPEEEEPFG